MCSILDPIHYVVAKRYRPTVHAFLVRLSENLALAHLMGRLERLEYHLSEKFGSNYDHITASLICSLQCCSPNRMPKR